VDIYIYNAGYLLCGEDEADAVVACADYDLAIESKSRVEDGPVVALVLLHERARARVPRTQDLVGRGGHDQVRICRVSDE
jgi:hypothetical protein